MISTSTFAVGSDVVTAVMSALRSIYQVREIQEPAAGAGMSVHAAQSVLDASEALLRELGLLDPGAN